MWWEKITLRWKRKENQKHQGNRNETKTTIIKFCKILITAAVFRRTLEKCRFWDVTTSWGRYLSHTNRKEPTAPISSAVLHLNLKAMRCGVVRVLRKTKQRMKIKIIESHKQIYIQLTNRKFHHRHLKTVQVEKLPPLCVRNLRIMKPKNTPSKKRLWTGSTNLMFLTVCGC